MFKKLLVLLFVFSFNLGLAQTDYHFKWLSRINGSSDDYRQSHCVDTKGNIYITGFSTSFDLSFGACLQSYYNPYSLKFIIAKYDSNGIRLWNRVIETQNEILSYACHTDSTGNLYVIASLFTATEYDTLKMDDNTKLNINPSNDRDLIMKYTPEGKCVWARGLSSKSRGWEARDFCLDDNNNLYIVGSLYGSKNTTIDYGNNVHINCINSTNNILTKFNSDGKCQWVHQLPHKYDSLTCGFNEKICYYNNNIYMFGHITDSTDFGDGKLIGGIFGVTNNGNPFMRYYISSYNLNGDLNWVNLLNQDFYGAWNCNDLAVDSKGNFFITGNSASGTQEIFPGFKSDLGRGWLAKCDNNGKMIWAHSFISDTFGVWPRQLIVDRNDDIYSLCISANGRKTWFQDSTISIIPKSWEYLVKLDKNGKYVNYFDIIPSGTPALHNIYYGSDFGYYNHCSIDKSNNIINFGCNYSDTIYPDGPSFVSSGGLDIFLIKYSTDTNKPYIVNPDFVSLNSMVLNRAAKKIDNYLRLTPSEYESVGTAWTPSPITIKDGFTSEFSFRFSEPFDDFNEGSLPGADGIAFVIQNNKPDYYGKTGGGIGFEGIANSFAIEFDTYKNSEPPYNDADGNHIAVFCNGLLPNTSYHNTKANLATVNNIPVIKSDSTVYFVKIEYNIEPNKLKVYFNTTNQFINPVLTIDTLDLSKLLNLINGSQSYLGFTASTGTSRQAQDILTWTLCTQPLSTFPVSVEEKGIQFTDDLLIYPNPVSKELIIKTLYPNQNIGIFDLLGNKLYNSVALGIETKINLEFLSSGVYFIKVGQLVRMFVKE